MKSDGVCYPHRCPGPPQTAPGAAWPGSWGLGSPQGGTETWGEETIAHQSYLWDKLLCRALALCRGSAGLERDLCWMSSQSTPAHPAPLGQKLVSVFSPHLLTQTPVRGNWSMFLREARGTPSLEVFRVRSDGALSNLL